MEKLTSPAALGHHCDRKAGKHRSSHQQRQSRYRKHVAVASSVSQINGYAYALAIHGYPYRSSKLTFGLARYVVFADLAQWRYRGACSVFALCIASTDAPCDSSLASRVSRTLCHFLTTFRRSAGVQQRQRCCDEITPALLSLLPCPRSS